MKREKLLTLLCLILGIIAACSSINPSGQSLDETPNRKVWITLAQNQHDQLFEQLRKFADKHSFTIRISQTNPTGEDFLVEMWRDDVEITAVDSGDPGLFKIGFYDADTEHPVPMIVVDGLIIDLKKFIEEIPNTTFTIKE